MITMRTSKFISSHLEVHHAVLLPGSWCYFLTCFFVWLFDRVNGVSLRHNWIGCQIFICETIMMTILHWVPLHLLAEMIVSVTKDSCGDCLSVSFYHPLVGDNVVKYRFILRSGVTFMELLADHGSALTLSFDCHLFNRFYHPMQIALPQMELVSVSCFWFQFYYARLFSNLLSFCVSACILITDSLI